MNVTCSRCGTSYDFDEGLVATTGTTVKCTHCGHLFKVFHDASEAPEPPETAAGATTGALRWRIRRVDGSTHTLESLSELMRLISAGQFQREDEISRTGQVWKRLGDIAELAMHFDAPARMRRMSEPPPEPRLRAEAPATTETPTAQASESERVRRRSGAAEIAPSVPDEIDEIDQDAGTQRLTPVSAMKAEELQTHAGAEFAAVPDASDSAGDTVPEAEVIENTETHELDRAIERQRRGRGSGAGLIALPTIALAAAAAYALFAHGARSTLAPPLAAPSVLPAPAPRPSPVAGASDAALRPASDEQLAAGAHAEEAPPSAPEPAPRPTATPSPADANAEPTPADPVELCRRGEAALERGAVQTAERAFDQAIEHEPQMPRAQTGLGYVALERSQPQKAATYFKLAAKAGRAEAFIGLGDAYRRLGSLREALDAYQTYLKRFPNGTRSSIARRQVDLLQEQLSQGTH